MPFDWGYRGGVSLATGWLAGSLGGGRLIIIGQLADTGEVKVFSSGSALDAGPALYLRSPSQHGHGAKFKEMASLKPFNGPGAVRVATTSTTSGAHLLVSGMSAPAETSVLKYDLVRPGPQAKTAELRRLGRSPRPAVLSRRCWAVTDSSRRSRLELKALLPSAAGACRPETRGRSGTVGQMATTNECRSRWLQATATKSTQKPQQLRRVAGVLC